MRKMIATVAIVGVLAMAVASSALAVTVPTVPVDDYGDALLAGLLDAVTAVFPYAAAVTAFAIGVGIVKRWLGHRKATRV